LNFVLLANHSLAQTNTSDPLQVRSWAAGSGGVSSAANELEGMYAMAWARNIWADTLA
jgi:hypothetical protein